MLTVDLDRLAVGPGDLLLDAGCGEGRHCIGAAHRGAKVVGLDLDRSALRQARAALYPTKRLAAVLCGDALHLPFRDASFGRVICAEVMEHVHDYRGALRELARITEPGGRLAVTVPTAISEYLYRHLSDDYFESPGGHIRIFSPRELSQAIHDAGFQRVRAGFAHALHTPYWALRGLVGLNDADANRAVRAYRIGLLRATWSPAARGLERLLNRVFPKSLILYAQRSRD